MLSKDNVYFFFYGTLQPGGNLGFFEQNKLGEKLSYVGSATIKGELVHLRNTKAEIEYPGVISVGTSDHIVHGSVFKMIDPSVLAVMDNHEDFTPGLVPEESKKNNFYQRIAAQAVLDGSGETISVQLYALNTGSDKYNSGIIENKGVVSSGNWLKYISRQ